MASSTFFIPSVNVIGADSLTDAMNMMADYGFTRTLIVTDNMLTKLGMAGDVQKALEERNIFSVIYDGTQPNPTTENVAAGLKLLKENNCDSVISLGGGSPHDCAKGIALVAANGGDIRDYEGVDRSAKRQLPMIVMNSAIPEVMCASASHQPARITQITLPRNDPTPAPGFGTIVRPNGHRA